MKMLLQEWKTILSQRMLAITLIVLICIPMLYNLFFLSSFWDPYGKLGQLPVTVVNNDQGASIGDVSLQIGSNFVNQLKTEESFNWQFADNKAKALQDLEDGKVFMVIDIPADFSQNAASLLSTQPKKMQLNYYTDPANNFAASQITTSAVTKLEVQIADAVRKEYSRTIFDNMKSLAEGYQQASDGAAKLDEGTGKLSAGMKALGDNLQKLDDGLLAFSKGITATNDGSVKLVQGINTASDSAAQLSAGSQQLASGAQSAQQGTKALEEGLGELSAAGTKLAGGGGKVLSGATQLQNGLTQSAKGLQDFSSGLTAYNDGYQKLNSLLKSVSAKAAGNAELAGQLEAITKQMDQLAASGTKLETGMATLSGSQKQLAQGADALVSGSKDLSGSLSAYAQKVTEASEGAKQLSAGSGTLLAGIQKVAGGNQQLSSGLLELKSGGTELSNAIGQLTQAGTTLQSGAGQLVDGVQQLQSGTGSLSTGITDLHKGLSEGAAQSKEVSKANETTYEMFAAPTDLVAHVEHKVPKYGFGMAPYIISIGFFASSLMFSTAFSVRTPSMKPVSAYAWFFSKYSVAIAVASLSAIVSAIVLLLGFELEVQSIWRFIVFSIIVALTFTTLLFLLTAAFGQRGQFLGFLVLLMQVASSEGTFPLVLTPKVFHYLNPLLPMTYSIRGFREVISIGTNYGHLWAQAGILACYLAVFIGSLLLTFRRLYRKDQLNPGQ